MSKRRKRTLDVKALARAVKDNITLDLTPVVNELAEILVDVKALGRRVTEIENRRRGVKTVKKPSFREMMQAHLNRDTKQTGDAHYVPAEPITAFFNAPPSEKMLKRRQTAAKAVAARRQAEQAADQKQRQIADAVSTMFNTKIVTAGVKNFDYSDTEARRKAQGRAAAQRVRDRVFRRL